MYYTKTLSIYVRLALLGLLSVLASCGGGGDSEQEKACDQMANGYFFIFNGIKCVFGATDNGTAKPSNSGTTGFISDNPSFGYETLEYEPNTSLDNANPLVLNDSALAVNGQLALADDASDNFVFTPTQSGDYRVYLCADSCDQALESSSLNLMVLDQSQTTIAATSVGITGAKALSIRLEAGLAYYTEVSTFGAEERYRLAITKDTDCRLHSSIDINESAGDEELCHEGDRPKTGTHGFVLRGVGQ
jgi:hypothetical protein